MYIDKAGNIAIRPPDLCTGIHRFSEGLARIDVLDTERVPKEVVAKVRAYRKEGLKDVFLSGRAWWSGNHPTKTGYLSVSGRMAIPLSDRGSGDYAGGLAVATPRVSKDRTIEKARTVEKDRTLQEVVDEMLLDDAKASYGYINVSGDWAIPAKFEIARPFSKGLACVKRDGKWGYIDVSGAFAIEPKYFRAEDFRDGVALVWTANEEKDGFRVHFIDRTGKTILVVEEDYIPIDLH